MTDSPNLDGLDLTPRRSTPSAAAIAAGQRRRSLRNLLVVGVIAAVLVAVLYQALTSARVYFYNVDEAVELRSGLADQHFRMHGTVVATENAGSPDASGALSFTLAYGEEQAEVNHVGAEPSGLFELGQNVVVEGHWDADGVFVSSQIIVKHSETYVEDNPDRFDEADADTGTADPAP